MSECNSSAETRRSFKGEWLTRVMDTNAALAAAGDPRALKGSEGTVLMAVAASTNDLTLGDAWPSVETIAARAGISVRMAKKALARLRDAGWLRVTRLGGLKGQPRSTTAYAMAYPDVASSATSTPPTGEPQFTGTGTGEPQFTGTGEPQFTGTGEPQFTRNGSLEMGPLKWVLENASDAPPRRTPSIADATEGATRALFDSDRDSNSAQTDDVIDAEVIDEPPTAATAPAAHAAIPDPTHVVIQAKELAEYAARQLRSHGSLKAICSRKTPNAFAELLNLGARNEQIRFAIDYAIEHRYWSGRVTTPEDITRNYDRIVADIRADMIQRNTPTRGESIADKNARLLAAAAAADRQETPA